MRNKSLRKSNNYKEALDRGDWRRLIRNSDYIWTREKLLKKESIANRATQANKSKTVIHCNYPSLCFLLPLVHNALKLH